MSGFFNAKFVNARELSSSNGKNGIKYSKIEILFERLNMENKKPGITVVKTIVLNGKYKIVDITIRE